MQKKFPARFGPRFSRVTSVQRLFGVVALAVACVTPAACASDSGGSTIRVPADETTIQEAVEKAHPGDLILIAAGTYNESIEVETKDIVIRGEDRNAVILDGQFKKINGFEVSANGVAIENLTVTGFTQNGIIFDGGYDRPEGSTPGQGKDTLVGYRVSHVTTHNNGLYGVYAFASRDGLIEYSYASGSADSGFYVGQCKPCNAVLTNLVAEKNAIGYFGTNASGGVYVINSEFTNNRLGMTPNSQKAELLERQEDTVVAGNWVHDNDDPQSPEIARGYFGGGIAVGGGTKNLVTKNLVTGNDGVGIEVTPLNDNKPENNRIIGNVASGNGVDLSYGVTGGKALGNCFEDNSFGTSDPKDIELVLPCTNNAAAVVPEPTQRQIRAPKGVDYRDVPKPGPQPTMKNPETAPAVPAGAPPKVDVASIKVPTKK